MPRSQTKASVDLPTSLIISVPETLDEQTLTEALEPLSIALAEHGAAASMTLEPPRVTVDMMVSVATEDLVAGFPDVWPAVDHALKVLNDLLGAVHRSQLISLTVQTVRAREEALEALEAARELVGVTEIARMRGQLRQAIQRTVTYPRFPRPVATVLAGSVYARRDVEEYYRHEQVRTAARGVTHPSGQAPDRPQRERLAELLRLLLEQQQDAAGGAADAAAEASKKGAGSPHWLLQPDVLGSAIETLGGPASIAPKIGVQPRQVYRWRTWVQNQQAGTAAASLEPA